MKVQVELDAGDATAVGHTLRAHGVAGLPNPETAAVLQRVGWEMIDAVSRAVDERTLTIPLHGAPPVISDSLISVLRAHGFVVARRAGEGPAALEALSPEDLRKLARELGNNATMCLTSIDRGNE